MSESYKQFSTVLTSFPGYLSTRCFAFEPTDNHLDTEQNVIMIPNKGELSFYLSTMIEDFAYSLLKVLNTKVFKKIMKIIKKNKQY